MGGQLHHRVEHRVFVLRDEVWPGFSLRRGYDEEKDNSASLSRSCSKYLEAGEEQTAAIGAALPKS
jgi:hypothetical protein